MSKQKATEGQHSSVVTLLTIRSSTTTPDCGTVYLVYVFTLDVGIFPTALHLQTIYHLSSPFY